MTDAEIKQDGNAENESAQSQGQEIPSDFEPLTATYERLRHSADAAELSEFHGTAGGCRRQYAYAVGRSRFPRGNHAVSEYSRQTVHRRIR